MNTKRIIGGPLLAIVFLGFFAYVFSNTHIFLDNVSNKPDILLGSVVDVAEKLVSQNIQANIQNTPGIEINAKSAISIISNLKDSSKVVINKDIDLKLSIASLTKLMTAVIVLDNYNLADEITVSETADKQDPMKLDVKFGDTMSVESFLDIMLIESSNKSAYALSEGPNGYPGTENFINLMNQKAKAIGMQNTIFVDPTGLSYEDISTAKDLAILAEYILRNKNYSKISDISKREILYVPGFGDVKNTNELLREIPNIICGKTGFTTIAKGCLLLVIDNPQTNDYSINVILGADDRFTEMKKIINGSSTTCSQPITNQ